MVSERISASPLPPVCPTGALKPPAPLAPWLPAALRARSRMLCEADGATPKLGRGASGTAEDGDGLGRTGTGFGIVSGGCSTRACCGGVTGCGFGASGKLRGGGGLGVSAARRIACNCSSVLRSSWRGAVFCGTALGDFGVVSFDRSLGRSRYVSSFSCWRIASAGITILP